MREERISPRLRAVSEALPVRPGMRILEIGCGPGVAARWLVRHHASCEVVAIDRSATAIRQAKAASQEALASGRLEFRCVAIEDFVLQRGERRFDLAFAVRVGALDGRHPQAGRLAIERLKVAMVRNGRLFIDGGDPLREISLRTVL